MESNSSQYLTQLAIKARIALLNDREVGIEGDDPFFIADLGQVYRQHRRWVRNLPAVKPFYAVKCNPDPALLRVLADLGTGFDCASIEELRTVLRLGVDPCRVVFANPCKAPSALRFARGLGVTRTTFDNLDELHTIKAFLPNAQLFLRIFANDDQAVLQLSEKFGALIESVPILLERAWELGLEVVGVSFHVGTGAANPLSFLKAIQYAKFVFDLGRQIGFQMRILDVGGGFQDSNFETMASTVREAIKQYIPSGIQVIAEPGRFYARSPYTLVCKVISRRVQIGSSSIGDKLKPDMLYQNDGVYGNFMNVLVEKEVMSPLLIPGSLNPMLGGARGEFQREKGAHRYSIWGPTCDSTDCVAQEVRLDSEVKVGDWLVYKNMGAYTMATATQFNGFKSDYCIIYINSESQLGKGGELPLYTTGSCIACPTG